MSIKIAFAGDTCVGKTEYLESLIHRILPKKSSLNRLVYVVEEYVNVAKLQYEYLGNMVDVSIYDISSELDIDIVKKSIPIYLGIDFLIIFNKAEKHTQTNLERIKFFTRLNPHSGCIKLNVRSLKAQKNLLQMDLLPTILQYIIPDTDSVLLSSRSKLFRSIEQL